MATMSGADADQLDEVGRRMTQAADHLDNIRHEVTTALGRAPWEGDDAADFHVLWNHRLAGLLQTTTAATRDASSRLHRNADQQRRASGSDSGSVLGGEARDREKNPWAFYDKASSVFGVAGFGGDLLKYLDKAGVKKVHDFLDKGVGKTLFGDHDFPGLSETSKGLGGKVWKIDHDLGPVWALSTAVDASRLIWSVTHGDLKSRDTLNEGVDTAFDLAEAVSSVSCPPLFIGVSAVHVAFDLYENLVPEHVHKVIEGAVANAVTSVVNAEIDGVKADVHAVQDVAGAVSGVVSGGVNAAKKLFHL